MNKIKILFVFVLFCVSTSAQTLNETSEKIIQFWRNNGVDVSEKVINQMDRLYNDSRLTNLKAFDIFDQCLDVAKLHSDLKPDINGVYPDYTATILGFTTKKISEISNIFSISDISNNPWNIADLQILFDIVKNNDQKFVNNQIEFYTQYVTDGVKDPYSDPDLLTKGYLLPARSSKLFGAWVLPNTDLTPEKVKGIVINTFNRINGTETDFNKSTQKYAFESYNIFEESAEAVEGYLNGLYTDIVVLKVDGYNAGLSFYNTGDNTINNIKLIKRNFLSSDNVITIGTIDAKKARVLTSSDLQNIDAGSFDEIQFDLLGYTITLDYNKQIKPFVATVEMNTISTDLYPGVAPEEVNFRVFINTNNINNEPFEISVDFDNKYSETIQTTTINGLKTINIPHTYTQKGVFFPKVTVRNLNLENTSSSSFNYLQLENPIKINYPVTQTINFYAGNNTVWTSNAVSSIIPVYDLKWDFDYKNSTFTKDKETNNNDNTNWIYLPASGNFTNNKVLQSTVALVASVNIDNLIYTDTAFQTINIFNPVIPKISFTPATKNIITDISSIPYPVNLSAAGSVSATGKPLNFRWYINQADSGSTESVRYKMSKQGKSTLQLLVTDGTYSNEITDSISLNFNVSYNPDAKLSRLEYFFDLEPGVGNGHSIPVNFQNSVLYANTTINCSNLSTGLHRIYFRAKDSSGKWSIPQSQIVIVQAFNPSSTQVTDAEYFFDQDPGYGNGIKMSVPAGNNVSISTLCNLQNITTGLHRVYFRVKDNLGNWSIPQSQLVIIQQSTSANKQLTDAEYFFDIDPGIGSGIKLPVQVGDSISVSTIENIKNITTGLHRIYFRVKDSSGNWGIPQSQLVIIQNSGSADNINYAEYFFDTDPGFGNATKFTITSSDDVLINETLNIENLVPGIHTLIVRVRDESGKWSIPVAAMFEVEKGIATDVNSFIANNENNYKIYGGKERLTVITPNKDINRKYQLKVYTLSGTLILGKHFVGSQKITINKGFYVVDILDDFHGNKITQKILTY